jgi:5'-3' exoribonuclease 1
MLKAQEVFPGSDSDGRVLEVRQWLKSKGVRDFEAVTLFCDQLTKVGLSYIFASVIRLPSIA